MTAAPWLLHGLLACSPPDGTGRSPVFRGRGCPIDSLPYPAMVLTLSSTQESDEQ